MENEDKPLSDSWWKQVLGERALKRKEPYPIYTSVEGKKILEQAIKAYWEKLQEDEKEKETT